MAWSGSISTWNAALLVMGHIAYTTFLFYQGRKQGKETVEEDVDAILNTPKPMSQNIVMEVAGLVLLVMGARWLVDSAVSIDSALGEGGAEVGRTNVAC